MTISKNFRMLGNDIVDLKDVDSKNLLNNTKFIQRVFTNLEQEIILHSSQPQVKAWIMWGAKEAAYKAISRYDRELVFSPVKFNTSEDLSSILYKSTELALKTVSTNDYVYVEAYSKKIKEENIITHIKHINDLKNDPFVQDFALPHSYNELSTFTRAMALSVFNKIWYNQKIQIENISPETKKRIPLLKVNDEYTDTIISLTHHGSWCAFTYLENIY